MRSSAFDISSLRPCVRDMWPCCTFPLAGRLPSIPSAPFGLFGDFVGTMQPSDCPRPSIIGSRPWTSQCGPPPHLLWRANVGSPSSRARCFRACTGSSTSWSLLHSRANDCRSMAFRSSQHVGAPKLVIFRGSIPDLHVPLSTLRLNDYSFLRMTRGQPGSLDLGCIGLSPTTPCRFILAHGPPQPENRSPRSDGSDRA